MSQRVFSKDFKEACYWKESMDWPLEVPSRDLPPTAEVVVVGGGFTGLSAARSLAKAGLQVVLLETEEIGAGASSRNGGIVHPTLGVSGQELIDRFGLELAKKLYRVIIDGIAYLDRVIQEENIDCHFNFSGAFEAAARQSHLDWMVKRTQLLAEVFDHHTEVIFPEERANYIGSQTYHGGWHDPLGATVHPARLVYGLGEAARRAGADLHPHTPVFEIKSNGPVHMHTVVTPRGSIRAKDVVIASNGYLGDLIPALRRRIIPLDITAYATEPLPDSLVEVLFPKRNCYWDTFRLFNYFQCTRDNRIVFGGVAAFPRKNLRNDAAAFHRRFARIFPEMNQIKLDYAWGGRIALTFDRLPHLGELGGIHYALGFNGDGVLLGCYLGSQIAAMVLGEGEPNPLSQVNFPATVFYRRRPWFMSIGRVFYGVLDSLGI
jgi:glycine/D-amino acid oxidase-like deaminating enzyme